jgi:uncharacterized membrane protein (UPF0127 family)
VQALVDDRGRVVCERCEVSDSFFSRLRGLLGRDRLPAREGLLLSPAGSVHTFFMRFPIDVVFLDKQLVVQRVVPDVARSRLVSHRGARRVLELPAGQARAAGIAKGMRLRLAEPA